MKWWMSGLKVFLLACSSFALSPNMITFTQLNANHIKSIFDMLQQYSSNRAKKISAISDRNMFVSMSQLLREGNIYASMHEESVFLGWTPLKDDARMSMEKRPNRNDNVGVAYRKTPLYFVFLEEIYATGTLLVNRIYYNPTIDMDVDMDYLITDLNALASSANQSLDITPLKLFDNGRWYLILSGIFKEQTAEPDTDPDMRRNTTTATS